VAKPTGAHAGRTVKGLDFWIDASEPESRHLTVTLEFSPDVWARGTTHDGILFLPTWTPGSYLIREYSRHLGAIRAMDADTGAEIGCIKIAKNRFRLDTPSTTKRVRVTYRVYAHDLSVRTADLTAEHAYWNHACVLLWPLGEPQVEARIAVIVPDGWDVACGLPQIDCSDGGSRRVVRFVARDLDQAVDTPCLLGRFLRFDWRLGDVPHAVVLDGLAGIEPPATLVDDLRAIARAASAVFGGALPYDSYLFLCLFAAEGHGGLEHASSTTLLFGRTALRSEKGYREFLSLAAHELFHAWNVKRLRPAEFWSYDYEAENYTSLLWLIEGWTAYYDDLLCLRAGLMSVENYLAIVSRNLTAMSAAPGRRELSLANSSFDAWIRLYRPDENTRNSSQNYYLNGAIAAMCLDLFVRRASGGATCLDEVLRELYGTTFLAGRGYSLLDVVTALDRVVGDSASRFLLAMVEQPFEPKLDELLAGFGVRMVIKDAERPHLGITFDAGKTSIASVQSDAPAHRADVAPGDEVLALNDLRVSNDNWQDVFHAVAAVGKPLEVLVARRGVISRRRVLPGRSPGTISLELDSQADERMLALRDGWLPRSAASGSGA